MTERRERNGTDPGIDVPRRRAPLDLIERPSEEAPFREIAGTLTDAVNELSARVNTIDGDVIETKVEVMRQGGALNRIETRQQESGAAMDRMADAIDKMRQVVLGPGEELPPVRKEMPSSVHLLEDTTTALNDELARRASLSPGPLVEATPEELTGITKEVLQRVLDKRDKAKKTAEELERLRAEARARNRATQKKADDRRSVIRTVVAGAILGVMTVVGGYLWAEARHAAGILEGQHEAPPVLVPVPAVLSAPPAAPHP